MIDTILQDLRFAFRTLFRRPLFLLVSVLSLSLGIGVNTTVFSAVKQFLILDPPGIPNASRMVEIGRGTEGRGFDSFSYPDFQDLREQAEPLEALAGYEMQVLTLSRGEEGDRVLAMLVSSNFFDVLGVRTAMGRTFYPEEDEGTDEHPVAILSHAYWKDRLGGEPDILGSTVFVSRKAYTVVGVTPENFAGLMAGAVPDVYVPIMQHPSLNEGQDWFQARSASWFQVLGLLAPGASADEADAAVQTVFRRLAQEYPETNARRSAAVRSYGPLPAPIRGPVSLFLTALMAFAGLILLVTCANVGGMFLARSSSRRREIAIRLAVGSSPTRLVRHLVTEYLVVFFLGGLGGAVLAGRALGWVSAWEPPAPFPLRLSLSLDLGVLAFAGALTLGAGLLFGMLPARRVSRLDLLGGLKGVGAEPLSGTRRMRRVFVGTEVGAALVLLAAAVLFLRALQQAGQIETGFQAEGAYISLLDLAQEGYDAEEGAHFQDEILRHFQDLPWVEDVALALDLPLDLGSHGTGVVPEGWQAPEGGEYLGTDFNFVSARYFNTLGIPVLEGRGFTIQDRAGSDPVAVVSRTFGQQAWPGQSALGRRVRWGTSGDTWLTVVGVVEDTQNQFLTDTPGPFLYRPLAQSYRAEGYLVLRSSQSLPVVTRGVRAGLKALDPRISLSPVLALDRYTEVSLLPQRIAAALSSGLGCLALLLSGMGIYGFMAFMVSRRRREIGIRAALGAEPGRVLRSVVLDAFRLALPGVLLGSVVATGVGYLLRNLLLGVSPLDPLALGTILVVVTGMVVAGTLVPARRAARVDPAESLRFE